MMNRETKREKTFGKNGTIFVWDQKVNISICVLSKTFAKTFIDRDCYYFCCAPPSRRAAALRPLASPIGSLCVCKHREKKKKKKKKKKYVFVNNVWKRNAK